MLLALFFSCVNVLLCFLRVFISHVRHIKMTSVPIPLFETPSSLLIVVCRSFYKISPPSPCNIHITRVSVALWLEEFTVLKRALAVCIDKAALQADYHCFVSQGPVLCSQDQHLPSTNVCCPFVFVTIKTLVDSSVFIVIRLWEGRSKFSSRRGHGILFSVSCRYRLLVAVCCPADSESSF